jgi:hypothetical protein
MSEHRIRLRGGWNCLPDPSLVRDEGEASGRDGHAVTLPHPGPWPVGPGGRVHLTRSFGPPRFDPASESLSLHLERVAGLLSVRLNGREIARPGRGTDALRLPIDDPLSRRNLLTLVLDVSGTGSVPAPWGEIALVISTRG